MILVFFFFKHLSSLSHILTIADLRWNPHISKAITFQETKNTAFLAANIVLSNRASHLTYLHFVNNLKNKPIWGLTNNIDCETFRFRSFPPDILLKLILGK